MIRHIIASSAGLTDRSWTSQARRTRAFTITSNKSTTCGITCSTAHTWALSVRQTTTATKATSRDAYYSRTSLGSPSRGCHSISFPFQSPRNRRWAGRRAEQSEPHGGNAPGLKVDSGQVWQDVNQAQPHHIASFFRYPWQQQQPWMIPNSKPPPFQSYKYELDDIKIKSVRETCTSLASIATLWTGW
jgi:hypothetical protein